MFARWDCRTWHYRNLMEPVLALSGILLLGCGGGGNTGSNAATSVLATGTPGAEVSVGERLFVETRFAQFFKSYLDSGGNVNDALPIGDPVTAVSETTGPRVSLPGPFARLSMNCRACHAAPNFTDFRLHNTGTTQVEYDGIHGGGAFAALAIPDLATRNGNYNAFLPATETHPNASERFRTVPVLANPTLTDLGVWNIFANPDIPNPQGKIRTILCDDQQPCPLTGAVLSDRALARFKTPGLRDLGHSAPYMHNGQFDALDNVIGFYRGVSAQARAGTLRNGAGVLEGIALLSADIAPLVTFLKSLNEDYQ